MRLKDIQMLTRLTIQTASVEQADEQCDDDDDQNDTVHQVKQIEEE